MNKRLLQIIAYKTGGKQVAFAELMGWSPQYLAKLIKGDNFGLQPVLTVLKSFPEISARWFLFGEGPMLGYAVLSAIGRQAATYIHTLLQLEDYIPVMTSEEIERIVHAQETGDTPLSSPAALTKWRERLTVRQREMDAKFAKAQAQSDALL